MGIQAARSALDVAGVDPETIDLVVVATCTADMIFPSCASQVQHGIGAYRAGAFDVNAACSGFVYALATASQFIASGAYQRVLVVGTEVFSRILDWTDRSTCVLFGDGAGALVLEASEEGDGLLSFVLGSDGAGAELLYVPGIGRPDPAREMVACQLRMNGPEVFRFAVKVMEDAAREAALRAGLHLQDIDLFIPHQANQRIIKTASRGLGIPPERVFTNVERYGNTSAASVPIALAEAADLGMLQPGQHVVLVGFGGGLSWASAVVRWSRVTPLADPTSPVPAAATSLP